MSTCHKQNQKSDAIARTQHGQFYAEWVESQHLQTRFTLDGFEIRYVGRNTVSISDMRRRSRIEFRKPQPMTLSEMVFLAQDLLQLGPIFVCHDVSKEGAR